MHETTPTLLAAARASGLHVARVPAAGAGRRRCRRRRGRRRCACSTPTTRIDGVRRRRSHAGFGGPRRGRAARPTAARPMHAAGLLALVGAYDGQRRRRRRRLARAARATTTELTGIARAAAGPPARGRRRGRPRRWSRTPGRAASARCSCPRRTTRSPGSTSGWGSSGSAPPASRRHRERDGVRAVLGRGRLADLARHPAAGAAGQPRRRSGRRTPGRRTTPPDEWREHLDEPDEVAVVAETAAGPAGRGAGYPDLPGLLHVVAMWVDPAARGQGDRAPAARRDRRLGAGARAAAAPRRRHRERGRAPQLRALRLRRHRRRPARSVTGRPTGSSGWCCADRAGLSRWAGSARRPAARARRCSTARPPRCARSRRTPRRGRRWPSACR